MSFQKRSILTSIHYLLTRFKKIGNEINKTMLSISKSKLIKKFIFNNLLSDLFMNFCNFCELFLLIFILLYVLFQSVWIIFLIVAGIIGNNRVFEL